MSYWKLVRTRAFKETRDFWNAHQTWKYAGPPISAIILRLLVRRWSPMTSWEGWVIQGIVFIVFGFIVTWGGTYLINLIRTPSILHGEVTASNVALENKVAEKERKIERLVETARPQIDPEIIKEAQEGWNKLKPVEKEAVRLLFRLGDLTDREAIERLNVPNQILIYPAIREKTKFVSRTEDTQPHELALGYGGTWTVNPHFREVLRQVIKKVE